MVMDTVKPSAVAVVLPNVGVKAAPTTDVAVPGAEASGKPVRVVGIVAVEIVPGATPVTVAKPVLLTATEPDGVPYTPHR